MYIAIPHELYDARNNNEISPSMYEVMVWLHRRADWASGKVRMVSAERISIELGGMFKPRTVQDAMNSLSKYGWITSHHVSGQKGSYWVTIHNFLALTGAQKEQVLSLNTVIAYKNGSPAECGDGALGTAGTVRRGCAEDSSEGATIQRPRDTESQNLRAPEPQVGSGGGITNPTPEAKSSTMSVEPSGALAEYFLSILPDQHLNQMAYKGSLRKWSKLLTKVVCDGNHHHVKAVITFAIQGSPFWSDKILSVQRVDPMEYFIEKYGDIEAKMGADTHANRIRTDRAAQEAQSVAKARKAAVANADKAAYRQVPGDQIVKKEQVLKF